MSVKEHIRTFLANKVKLSPNELEDLTEVYSSGTFSSLVVLELLSHLETTFDIEIGPSDLNQKNFKHIQSISELVERQLSSKVASATA